ncbi:alpha/beta hydrolase [Leptospira gomenensis]|uniref:Alpha/beta hydrolase n=1 Tax=Leptospira gomenensis TaxID=2484974 RepID=A0A5F1YN32_9LEPT|nr:prolyl oligopeptidase family serine peptidase [Leptospira gomenensis]TGK32709.1 alpha/beta hydrolase [Leptospira gomenensis]TGK36856.1 alpha/beta hydrolase [Leptospira gomenensis]TGK39932.1 alpha/beta hydrolase [Leptospira gomenensis]TGK58067.1 alpha/beta hydrolase [Leptospira gomenensis]
MKRIRIIHIIAVQIVSIFLHSDCTRIWRKNSSSIEEAQKQNITVENTTRTFLIHTPINESRIAKRPLVIILHGRLGNGRIIMQDSGFNSIADRENFIAVYPEGLQRSWADGRGATPSDRENVDDVRFIETLIDHLVEKFSASRENVFIVGHSNGGFMTQRILIEMPKRFRAGASVASQISEYVLKNFRPDSPVSVAFLNGTEDPIVPYYGGYVRDGGEILSVDESVSRWLEWNSCKNSAALKIKDETDDDTRLEMRSYGDCAENTEVRQYRIVGAGHNWPGTNRKIPFVNMGKPTRELNTAEEIWSFFKTKLKTE